MRSRSRSRTQKHGGKSRMEDWWAHFCQLFSISLPYKRVIFSIDIFRKFGHISGIKSREFFRPKTLQKSKNRHTRPWCLDWNVARLFMMKLLQKNLSLNSDDLVISMANLHGGTMCKLGVWIAVFKQEKSWGIPFNLNLFCGGKIGEIIF